jgi:hypothetical protein
MMQLDLPLERAIALRSMESSCEKFFSSGRSSQFKPKRSIAGLDGNAQAQERAALTFKIDELS